MRRWWRATTRACGSVSGRTTGSADGVKVLPFKRPGRGLALEDADEVVLQGFFVYSQGGKQVLSLDAKFDLRGVHPGDRAWVVGVLRNRAMYLAGPSPEQAQQHARQMRRYRERKAEYEALPWWRRVFTRRPWSTDEENG